MQHAQKQCKTPEEVIKISWKTPGKLLEFSSQEPAGTL